MKIQHPLIRLLTLTSFAIVMGLTVLLSLRWLGSQERFSPSNHPWMGGPVWLLARLDPAHCDQDGLHALQELGDAWRLWLDLQLNREKEWMIVCPEHPFSLDGESTHPQVDGLKLRDVLPQLKNQGVIFNVRAMDIESAKPFLQTLEAWAGKRIDIGIASPAQSLLRELRKRRPEWLFAADFATWTKLKMYAGLGVETTADLWPDFFVASNDSNAPNFFSAAAANEIARRKKVLLIEWTGSDVPEPWKEHLRGILTNRPKNFPVDAFFGKMGAK